MLAPPAAGPTGRCPSCQAPGPVGERCVERVCMLREYHFIPVDDAPIDLAADQLIGQRCGDYLITGLLGAGGFGRVYRALQLPVGMPAALKLIDVDGGPSGMATIKVAKFEVEAQALARLSHPNIVRLYQYGQHRGAPFLAMELVEGAKNLWTELETRAAERRPLSLDEVQAILMQVLAALEAAHERQIVHRDIKPENVMLQSVPGHGLFVKVLDFGLAKFTEDRNATSMLLGTPAYMAHEQILRGKLGPWTDLYALGVLAFELMTGKRPYGGGDVQTTLALKLDAAFDPWSRVAGLGFPEELRIFVAHALAPEPEARYANAADFRAGLQHALDALRAAGHHFTSIPVARLVEATPLQSGSLPAGFEPPPAPTKRLMRPSSQPAQTAPEAAPEPPRPLTTSPTGVLDRSAAAPSPSARRHLVWRWLVVAAAAAAAVTLIAIAASRDDTPSSPAAAVTVEGAPPPAPARSATSDEPPALAPVTVAAGRFARGSAPHDPAHEEDETLHEVVLGRDLIASPTEVTQAEWAQRFATRPWRHLDCGPRCPVDSVTWWDAVAYANALSEADGLTPCYALRGCRGTPGDTLFACRDARFEGVGCTGWRLPTEAEWEFLARAQSPPPESLDDYAQIGGDAPRPVAGKLANAFGLHDLFGNVREWVHDAYGRYPDKGIARDPVGPGGEGDRVIRGGSYRSPRSELRAAARDHAPLMAAEPDLGFRLVRSAR